MAIAAAMILGSTGTASAQFQSYAEDFDTDNTANWTANPWTSGTHTSDFYFDYSTAGIPPAPNSINGSTRGMKLTANMEVTGQVLSGISASPVGLNLQGDYIIRFDMWCNFNGPAPTGGSGSTQVTGGGFGSSGTYANFVGRADGVWMAVTGDGESSADYRVYGPGFAISYQPESGIYASGSATTARNNTTPYWATNFPGQTLPPAQTALFSQQTGETSDGAQAFKWRDVEITKLGTTATFKIDGVLMATVEATNTLGGGNLLFVQSDINGTASTDPNRYELLFGLFDNIRVTNLTGVVSVSILNAQASEFGSPAMFRVTRSEAEYSSPRTVNITLTGTAVNGTDYPMVPLTVTIPAGEEFVDVTIMPTDDTESEFLETIILTIVPGTGYSVGTASATATIDDNDTPTISVQTLRPTAYERINGDYIGFNLVRKGNLSEDIVVFLSYGGTAASSRYTPVDLELFYGGSATQELKIPVNDDSLLNGDQTVIVTVTSGSGYNVDTSNTSATGTILDDEAAPEQPIYSANFNSASSTGFSIRAGSGNMVDDYRALFGFDYSSLGIPAAPHGSDTTGLYLTVNKDEATATAAGVNVYPTGQTFSGDFAARVDMYLVVNSTATSEYALIGINHSGDETNWFRLSGNGFTNSVYDGVWAFIEADATGNQDYMMLTGPVSNYSGVWGPTRLTSTDARSFTNTFKSPPWFAGTIAGGSPSNPQGSSTPNWADVEMSQIGGVITLKINRTEIMRYTNTTAHTSGTIMLGYADPFDSNTGTGGAVIFDNLRVVNLSTSVTVEGIEIVGSNVEVTFMGNAGDTISSFTLQKTGSLETQFADTQASITSLGNGRFKATRSLDGGIQFYRVRRN